MLNLICLYDVHCTQSHVYIILVIDFFNIQEINSLIADLDSRYITSTKGRTSFKSLSAIIYFHTGIFIESFYPGTDEEYTGGSNTKKRYVVNKILQYLFKTISVNPNPNGERFWDVIPVSKSAIDIHHPIEISYDLSPSDLVKYGTDIMISELKRGKCKAVWRADHIVFIQG